MNRKISNKRLVISIFLLILLGKNLPHNNLSNNNLSHNKIINTSVDTQEILDVSDTDVGDIEEIIAEEIITEEIVYATTYSESLVEYIKQPNVEGFHEKAYICGEDSDGLNAYTIGYRSS